MENSKRRCYIAGPMSGYPAYNADAFNERAAVIESLGYVAVNPADWICEYLAHGLTKEEMMRRDVMQLVRCDAYTLLKNHEYSPGATVERVVADACGLERVEVE